MISFAVASGIGAPKVLIILLTSASQVGAGNGGCMVMYRVLWHVVQKSCVSARPSPSANSGTKEGKGVTEKLPSCESCGGTVCSMLFVWVAPQEPLWNWANTAVPTAINIRPAAGTNTLNLFLIATLLHSPCPLRFLAFQSCSTSILQGSRRAHRFAHGPFHQWPAPPPCNSRVFSASTPPPTFETNKPRDPRLAGPLSTFSPRPQRLLLWLSSHCR